MTLFTAKEFEISSLFSVLDQDKLFLILKLRILKIRLLVMKPKGLIVQSKIVLYLTLNGLI